MNKEQMVVNAIRVLSAEAVQKAKSGHPGMPMGAASMAYALWGRQMKHNPQNPKFLDRDRFVLSSGHGSMLLYSLLHLFGYGLSIDDLKAFRQFGSKTPGHPEYRHTTGVETTTGPLGQGIANAVGMAMAERRLAAKFNREGFPVVDHYTYAILGDGCMMEGISHECCSLAGTLKLNKLIALYDDNEISIEGSTDLAFREDVPARFRAYGWNVIDVPDGNCPAPIDAAITLAKKSDKPTLIVCHTDIGYGSPKAGQASAHGEPLGEENVQLTKKALGWPEGEPFCVPQEVYEQTAEAAKRGAEAEAAWNRLMDEYAVAYPELRKEWDVWNSCELPVDLLHDDAFWAFDGKAATRNSSGILLNRLAERVPNLFGGSADLAPSNKSEMKGKGEFSAENYAGANIHFGVREHAMAAISNGIKLHGGLRPYCATFFVFTDYMKNAMRMASIMDLPIPYILTHDSIGVGEDGPTHQPVEHVAALRAIPNLLVFRPADANETAQAWRYIFQHRDTASAILLTRQSLPVLDQSKVGPATGVTRGAYVLVKADRPDVLLLASGSEVSVALAAADKLAAEGIKVQVVSMPCWGLFERQPQTYKDEVLPPACKARVGVEAQIELGWHKWIGDKGIFIGMSGFGKSGPFKTCFEKFGITPDAVVAAAKRSMGR